MELVGHPPDSSEDSVDRLGVSDPRKDCMLGVRGKVRDWSFGSDSEATFVRVELKVKIP